jgi:hypothetical protein
MTMTLLFPSVATRVVRYCKETTYGQVPTDTTTAQTFRRTQFGLNLTADSQNSNEIIASGQLTATRLGTRKVEGLVSCELSPGCYSDLWANLLRSSWQMGDPNAATPGLLWVPEIPATTDSFTLEVWDASISSSTLYTGCRCTKAEIKCPASGNATVDFTFTGQDMNTGKTQVFTTALADTHYGILAAISGTLSLSDPADETLTETALANITSFAFTIDSNATTQSVVGSNLTPDVLLGPLSITGTFSSIYLDNALQQKFTQEIPFSLALKFTTPGDKNYMEFAFPYIRLSQLNTAESRQSIIQNCSFIALLNPIPSAYDLHSSCIRITDSTLVGTTS